MPGQNDGPTRYGMDVAALNPEFSARYGSTPSTVSWSVTFVRQIEPTVAFIRSTKERKGLTRALHAHVHVHVHVHMQ